MADDDNKTNDINKQTQIDSSELEARRARFNIRDSINLKSDIPEASKTLIWGLMRDNIDNESSLYSTELPMEVVSLIYSFYQTLIIHFGLRFYYWNYYKHIRAIDEPIIDNINDHSGYTPAELFINPNFKTLKEEVISHISMEEYTNSVNKANQSMTTLTVKTMKASGGRTERLHYQIQENAPIYFHHIISLILFTDFTQLCKDFKHSFCPISDSESLEDIKKRNGKYFWMSKRLREAVELYGMSGDKYDDGKLSGPFYASTWSVLTVSEFNVRSCLPLSTSRKLEVAQSYAGDHGMVLMFNNKGYQYERLKGFDCSFISKCPQESEIIFFGGQYFIKLENIIMMKSNQDLDAFIHVLGYLDTLLTGGDGEDVKLTAKHFDLLSEVFKGGSNSKNDYISAFVQRKKQIILDLYALAERVPSAAQNYLFTEIVEGELSKSEELDGSFTNLLRPTFLEIFPNIKSIVIDSNNFVFSFVDLLHLIQKKSIKVKVMAAGDTYEGTRSWLMKVWCQSSDRIQKLFLEQNYNISFQTMKGQMYNEPRDLVVIKPM